MGMFKKSIFAIALMTLCVGFGATSVFALMPSYDDLWDISEGYLNAGSITTSGMHTAGNKRNMFGGNYGTSEIGNTLFSDDNSQGYTHSIEWVLNTPVTVGSINLVARHDSAGITHRGFSSFRLLAWDGSDFVNMYTWNSPPGATAYGGGPNYSSVSYLELYEEVTPVTSNRFRAEFVQAGPRSWSSGPRIVELDAYSPVIPEPVTFLLLGSGILGLLGVAGARRRVI